MSHVKQELINRLNEAFSPTLLEVIDESHLHVGHASAPKDGQSHFRVRITSELFSGKSRLECHKMVYSQCDELLKSHIHALAIRVDR